MSMQMKWSPSARIVLEHTNQSQRTTIALLALTCFCIKRIFTKLFPFISVAFPLYSFRFSFLNHFCATFAMAAFSRFLPLCLCTNILLVQQFRYLNLMFFLSVLHGTIFNGYTIFNGWKFLFLNKKKIRRIRLPPIQCDWIKRTNKGNDIIAYDILAFDFYRTKWEIIFK